MPSWKEEKERLRFLIKEGKLTDEMRVRIVIPSIDARSRMENNEKRKEIRLKTDEQNYKEFHTWREAYMITLGENPTLVMQAIIEAMKTFNVKGWFEKQGDEQQEPG